MKLLLCIAVLNCIVIIGVMSRRLEYTVAEGDTMWSIAESELGDPHQWPQIVQINKLPDPDMITVGQVLILPNIDDKSTTLTPPQQSSTIPSTSNNEDLNLSLNSADGCVAVARTVSLEFHNRVRLMHNVAPLVLINKANQIAQDYARFLAINNLFEHSSSQSVRAQLGLGENLAMSTFSQGFSNSLNSCASK
jgi:LysM repeat protein